jgi:hypothetical protein
VLSSKALSSNSSTHKKKKGFEGKEIRLITICQTKRRTERFESQSSVVLLLRENDWILRESAGAQLQGMRQIACPKSDGGLGFYLPVCCHHICEVVCLVPQRFTPQRVIKQREDCWFG